MKRALADQARRLLALAICAETPERAAKLRELSHHAQRDAGVEIAEDDTQVRGLVRQYSAEDRNYEARSRPMIMEKEELRRRAIRLMAMAICAESTERYTTLMEMSRVAQIGAGVEVNEADQEVQDLVAQYQAEDKAASSHEQASEGWERDNPGARCPPRE